MVLFDLTDTVDDLRKEILFHPVMKAAKETNSLSAQKHIQQQV
jgi:hypothetical protein